MPHISPPLLPWLQQVQNVGNLHALSPKMSQVQMANTLGLTPPMICQCLKIWTWLEEPEVAGAASLYEAHRAALEAEREVITAEMKRLLGLGLPEGSFPTIPPRPEGEAPPPKRRITITEKLTTRLTESLFNFFISEEWKPWNPTKFKEALGLAVKETLDDF